MYSTVVGYQSGQRVCFSNCTLVPYIGLHIDLWSNVVHYILSVYYRDACFFLSWRGKLKVGTEGFLGGIDAVSRQGLSRSNLLDILWIMTCVVCPLSRLFVKDPTEHLYYTH